ncbi:MAG: Ig-like domain-containing protein [Desulfobulbaceae bacterium]|nr:Ig-like domain-containing protein [Desulfobulbaceae bacterium]
MVTITVVPPLAGATPKESITYSWEYDATVLGVTGFKLYMNGEFLCETTDPAARSLTCLAPVTSGVKTFYLQAVVADATATSSSNIIAFDPNAPVPPPAPVNVAPTAANQTLTLAEDATLDGTLSAADTNNDPLTFALVVPPKHGAANVTASGAFTYTPTANFNGADSFTFKANDGKMDSAEATVALTISPVNDAPVATDGMLETAEDTSASGQLTATDPEGDSLSYSIVTNGAKGVAKITNAATGTFAYIPSQNENGQDSFVYRVSDGKLGTEAKIVVNIAAVNDAPIAVNDTVETTEDTIVSGRFLGSDLDGDRLSYSIITNGSKGQASLVDSAIGLFTYTPSANENGQDVIVYRVSDGVLTVEATETVTISSVNDAPMASPDASQVESGKQVSIAVLGNDSDIENDPLAITSVTAPAHGQAVIMNGEISYTANVDFEGTDSFSYSINDGNGGTATAIVTVTVVAPVVVAPKESLVYTWDYDSTIAGTTGFKLYLNGELLCETSNPAARTLTCQAPVTSGAKVFYLKAVGTNAIETNASNSITFDPNQTVPPPVKTNTAPVPTNQTLTLLEDVPANGILSATDSDSDALTFSLARPPVHGTATVASSGAFTYTPSNNFNGTDTFTFKVNDGLVDSVEATVTLVVSPVNDAPKAVSISLWATEDVVASGQLPGSDVDGDQLSYSIVTNGSKGSVAIVDSANGAFIYTPRKNVNGQDTFTYRLSDGILSADATVTVIIEPVNDAPVANPDAVQVARNSKVVINVLANDVDVDGDTLTVLSLTVPAHGKAVVGATGAITYTPTRGYRGTDSFKYTVSDGKGGAAIGAVNVRVK